MNRLVRWLAIIAIAVTALGAVAGGAPPSASAQAGWTAQVYNDRNLTTGPVWTGTTGAVNFTWGQGTPVINGVSTTSQTDNFSVRFTSTAFFSGSRRTMARGSILTGCC